MLNLIRRFKKEHRYHNSMMIELTRSDKEYARRHGLTFEDMRNFKFDQIKEEEHQLTWYEAEEKKYKDFKNSTQAIYPAW